MMAYEAMIRIHALPWVGMVAEVGVPRYLEGWGLRAGG